MVAWSHSAVGATVGLITYQKFAQTNPILGLVITPLAGMASHYIADFIPHGHFVKASQIKKYLIPILIFDVFLSVALFLGVIYLKEGVSLKFLYILFGIGGSLLPDVIAGLSAYKKHHKNLVIKIEEEIHGATHWHGYHDKSLMLGVYDVWQLTVVIFSFLLLLVS